MLMTMCWRQSATHLSPLPRRLLAFTEIDAMNPDSAAEGSSAPSLSFSAETLSLPLYTVAQLRSIERAAMAPLSPHTLMGRAGQAAAQFIIERLPASHSYGPRVWLAAGPGNNGGDALATATELHVRGVAVEVLLPTEPVGDDARWALERARWAGVPIHAEWPPLAPRRGVDAHPSWYVDGLFGIGLGRALDGRYGEIAAFLSSRRRDGHGVLALDIPSGLDSDTGLGTERGLVVAATHTLTFIGAKPGLFTGAGRDHAGSVWVAPLGLSTATAAPTETLDASLGPLAWLNAPAGFAAQLPRRKADSHKGSFGSLAVLGGDDGMVGAPVLSARAALYAGAGKVHLALLSERGPAYDPLHPEIMLNRPDALAWDDISAFTIGPGMGQGSRAQDWLQTLLAHPQPKVLDADALNLIAGLDTLARALQRHGHNAILTPHPLECARLLGCNTAEIQRDRLSAARALAARYGCVVVLKGSGTVVAEADGACALNPTGNPGLATGGTGDVLGGLLGALLAQGCAPFPAACAAVYLHGLAADVMTAAGHGPAGLTASELAPMFRTLLNRLVREADETERGTALASAIDMPTPTLDP